ncbi:uncharacterized protein METZ01_LOCUS105260 [marine metagenome]|uniref:Luciferase-like domain-containing protein n=1 Tax=marine metagenome TaxID=408172 RepID=A0A381WIS9_9ZZZZ
MKLGLSAGYSPAKLYLPIDQVLKAEQLGFDSVWTAEAYGSDSVTPAAWILAQTTRIKVGTAIMQMSARTPTCTAMTALTLGELSGGRFILGLGPSGPGVIEGWYGVPFGRPMTRTHEYISIIRKVIDRKEPLTHEGHHYQIPYRGEDATGLGRPLKSILHAEHPLKIYTAAVTPNGLRCAAALADGVFPIWMNPSRFDLFEPWLKEGFAAAGYEKDLGQFDVAPLVQVSMGPDVEQCRRPIKERMALYVGGMGPREKNFYNSYTRRLGYDKEAQVIQDLYLSGQKDAAADAVPDSLVDECALVGPAEHIQEQLIAWKEAGRKQHVGTMLISGASLEALELLAEELL